MGHRQSPYTFHLRTVFSTVRSAREQRKTDNYRTILVIILYVTGTIAALTLITVSPDREIRILNGTGTFSLRLG